MLEYDKNIEVFNVFINRKELNVVEFYTTWCGPCKLMLPLLEKLESSYPNILFTKIDVEQNNDLKETLEIKSVPTIMLIKNGNILDTKQGYVPEVVLKKWIEEKLLN